MAATSEIVTGPGVPKEIGPYSPGGARRRLAVRLRSTRVDPENAQPVGSTFGEQARQTFRNLDAVLRAGGSRPELVVNTTVLVADANDFAEVNELYRGFLRDRPAGADDDAGDTPAWAAALNRVRRARRADR
jgi:2-iminobutanoate/2-iminopropanoate deaminase